jgi:hypothetical protein
MSAISFWTSSRYSHARNLELVQFPVLCLENVFQAQLKPGQGMSVKTAARLLFDNRKSRQTRAWMPCAQTPGWRDYSANPRSASANTRAPFAIASGEEYSSGRWLTPPRQGINNIATGAISDMKSES